LWRGARKDCDEQKNNGSSERRRPSLVKPDRCARLPVMLRLEVRVLGPSLEEVDIGTVKVLQCLLQDLAIGFFQPGIVGLENINQVRRTVVVVQACASVQVVSFAYCPIVIVDKSGMTELNRQRLALRLVRIDAKIKRLADDHRWTALVEYDPILASRFCPESPPCSHQLRRRSCEDS